MVKIIHLLGILIYAANSMTASFLDLEAHFHRKREKKESNSREKYSVCRTQECFQLASEFWESMNKSADPCEDFYEFACGGWSTSNPVPPTEMSWSTFNVVRKELNLRIRDLLEKPITKNDILPIRQIKKFYWSCMDVDALEKDGIKPIEAILSRNGGWPISLNSQEWNPEEFTWQQIDAFYTRLIVNPAFYSFMNAESSSSSSLDKSVDDSNESKSSSDKSSYSRDPVADFIGIGRPILSPIVKMPPEAKFNRTNMYQDGSYANLITQVAIIFAEERGTVVDTKKISDDVEGIIEFEKKLYENYYEAIDDFEGSLEDFQNYYNELNHNTDTSKINWKNAIRNIFLEANIELNGTEPVLMSDTGYLKNLPKILDSTNVRTIVNYVHWNFISRMLEFTNTKMETLLFEINKKQVGVREMKPRWERCIENVDMKHAISYLFVKNFFEHKMKDEANKIFESIQNEIAKNIVKSDWLDEKTRNMELRKIKNMKTNIGYPNWYKNVTEMLNHYRGVSIGQNFMDNKISYMRFSSNKNIRAKRKAPNEDFWRIYPIVVNAYYNPLFNSLTVTAADFLSPFYSANRPETINYGFLGAIIGHEISHGFDNSGIFFDEKGKNADWPKNTMKNLKKKMLCYYNQYVNFYNDSSIDLETLMGISESTLGENIADSLGLQMMFGAFKEKQKERNYPRLPGFEELSGEQSFFLSFAKLWCINTTPEYEKLKQLDSHSEGKYRVISAAQNSDGFAKAYKCPKNSPMNPEKKCSLW